MDMVTFAPIGFLIWLCMMIVPIVITVFVLIWLYRIKKTNEMNIEQNKKIIQLLEEIKNR